MVISNRKLEKYPRYRFIDSMPADENIKEGILQFLTKLTQFYEKA